MLRLDGVTGPLTQPMPAKGRKMSHPRSLASEPGLQGSSDSQSYALPWSPSVQKDVLFLCHKD